MRHTPFLDSTVGVKGLIQGYAVCGFDLRRGVEVAHYGSCSGDDSFPPTVDVLSAKRSEEKAKKSQGKQSNNYVKPKFMHPGPSIATKMNDLDLCLEIA